MNTQALNQIDPLAKQPEQGVNGNDMSPMDPPDAYAPPAINQVLPSNMHPFLRQFCDEHTAFMEELKNFEEAILLVQKACLTKELDKSVRHFFHFFDADFAPHSHREEVTFFPLLKQRLMAKGEHAPITGINPLGINKTTGPVTPIDILEDDHLKAVQLAAVVLNFLGLAFRLPDEKSRLIVLDAALEQGKNLVELLRLHIFREDNIVFALAHQLISGAEFDRMHA